MADVTATTAHKPAARSKAQWRVQRRDGLPKACTVDDWLAACLRNDPAPLFGGVVWFQGTLCMVARIKGRVHALPFEKCTGDNPFRSALNEEGCRAYDKMRADGIAGAYNAWVEKHRKAQAASDIGF